MYFFKLLSIVLASVVYVESYRFVKRSSSSQNLQTCGVQTGGDDGGGDDGSARKVDDSLEEEDGLEGEPLEGKTRVVNGVQASHHWPWMVSIARGGHICGGSVIDQSHVVTAAHCFDDGMDNDPEAITLYVGELTQRESGKSYSVESIHVHEDYNPAPNWFNDIAILTLKEPLPDDVVPVCLPEEDNIIKGDLLTIIGFGALEEGGDSSQELQEVHNLSVISTEDCTSDIQALHDGHAGVTDKQVCTAQANEMKGSCQGDSGGPLMQEKNAKWTLIGLVSFSVGCSRPGVPTVYTRVAAYRSWIDQNING